MKALAFAAAATLLLHSGLHAAEKILDSASTERVPISGRQPDPPSVQSGGLDFQPLGPGLITTVDGRRVRIRVLEIRPIRGNNFLDPFEPLLNFNGTRVQTITELVNLVAGGVGGGGAGGGGMGGGLALGCAISVPMQTVFVGGFGTTFGANFNIDAQSLSCTQPPPGIVGQGNFSFTLDRPSGAGGPLVGHFAGSPPPGDSLDWQFDVGGALTGVFPSGPPNQIDTLIVVSKFGPRIEIRMRVDDPGTGTPTLNVLSIRRLS